MIADSFIESCTTWALSQLQPSRNSRMEEGTRWCSDTLQCLWTALCQTDTQNGRQQSFLPRRLEPEAKESRPSVPPPMNDTPICSELQQPDQGDNTFPGPCRSTERFSTFLSTSPTRKRNLPGVSLPFQRSTDGLTELEFSLITFWRNESLRAIMCLC